MGYLIDTAREVIERLVKSALKELGLPVVPVVIEHPKSEAFGDLSINTAMILASRLSRPGVKIANQLADYLNQSKPDFIDSIKSHPPGFVNFSFKVTALLEELNQIISKSDTYGAHQSKERVLIDYSSPNIAKRFSIGHLRSTLIGQALANVFQFSGYQVIADNHLGDWGTQFGIIIAAIERYNLDITGLSVTDLEAIYVKYNQEMDQDPTLKDKARAAFARLEQGEVKAKQIWTEAVKVSMEEFTQLYKELEVMQFSPIFSPKIQNQNPIKYAAYGESYYENIMPDVIDKVKNQGIAKLDKGALVVKFDNMTPAILVKSDGATTYLTRDLATVWFRENNPELKSQLYIYEVGAEQKLHFRQLFKIVDMLNWCQQSRLVHVAHGMVRLPEGKMSTRKGRTVKVEDLIAQMKAKSVDLITNPEMDQSEKQKLSHIVGVGALKYNELKRSPASNYTFQWSEALNLQSNSGPYLQYTYARSQSLLNKAKAFNIKFDTKDLGKTRLNQADVNLLKWLYRFPEAVVQTRLQFAPNVLVEYLNTLAGRYNTFYNQNPILKADFKTRKLRLTLTLAVGVVIKTGLALLGIRAPDRM